MKTLTKPMLLTLLALFVLATSPARAGELSPPGAPAPTMHSLQEVFDQAAQANIAAGGGNTLIFYPYVLERSGKIADTQYTFDTQIDLTLASAYIGGGKGVAPVTVNLYLFSNNGQPATSGLGTQIANPATFTLSAATPHTTVVLEDLIVNAGGFASSIFVGYAVLSISSGDWNDVALSATMVNAHTGPGDVTITQLQATRVSDPGVVKKNEPAPATTAPKAAPQK